MYRFSFGGYEANSKQLRTENDDIMVYTPFSSSSAGENTPSLCFFREANHTIPPNDDAEQQELRDQRRRPLRILPDISGYSTVFLPGNSASFIFRTSTSSPHVIRLRGDFIPGLSSFDSSATGCDKGFIYLDSTVSSFPFSLPPLGLDAK